MAVNFPVIRIPYGMSPRLARRCMALAQYNAAICRAETTISLRHLHEDFLRRAETFRRYAGRVLPK